jgi:hypothetical protein
MLFLHSNACFQPRQPGQTSVDEVKRSNLRTELLAAETEARAKKRKAAGLPVEDESPAVAAIEDEDANKRRKVLQEALELDKDADSDEDGDGEDPKGNAECVGAFAFSLRHATDVLALSGTAGAKAARFNVGVAVMVMTARTRMAGMTRTRMMTTRTTRPSYFGNSRR